MSRAIEQLRKKAKLNAPISPNQRLDRNQRLLIAQIEDRKKRKEARRRERRQEATVARQASLEASFRTKLELSRQATLDAALNTRLELSRKFEQAGSAWKLYLEQDIASIAKTVRQEWRGVLPEFVGANEADRISLLHHLADGLGFSEENPEALRQEASFGAFFRYPLDSYHQTKDGNRFSLASGLLVEVVGEISLGYSEHEKSQFRNDIINSPELRGLPSVSLPQTFSPIAKWLSDPSVRQSPRVS